MSYRTAVVGGRFALDRRPTGGTIVSCVFVFADGGADMPGGSERPVTGAAGRSEGGLPASTGR